jgi:hypothetical protein
MTNLRAPNPAAAGAGIALLAALVWFGLIQLVSSTCDYDCSDKGGRDLFLAVIIVVALVLPLASLFVVLRPITVGWLPRILLGANVLISTACALVAVGLTILVLTGGADALVGLVALILWIGTGLSSLVCRRLNHLTGS